MTEVELGAIATIRQGRYLAPNSMSPAATLEVPIPVWGARGILGYTAQPTYADPIPLVTCRGNGCGLVQWTESASHISNNAMAIVPNSETPDDTRYLYYALMNEQFGDVTTGSAQPQITITHLSKKRVPWHDSAAERARIANVLSAFDDKLTLNRKMSATLEAMARALFKSWFVDFDPARAKAEGRCTGLPPDVAALFPTSFEMTDGREIPTGWVVRTIGSIGRVVTGKTPLTSTLGNFGGPYPFITIPDLGEAMYPTEVGRTISEAGARAVKGSSLPIGSVMMSCIATVGRCGITTRPSFTNQQINSVICGNEVRPEFLYWTFRNLSGDLEKVGAGGSVYTNVSKSRFSEIRILLPSLNIQEAFAGPWFEKLKANYAESITLAKLRDALLPKLISGEVRVRDRERVLVKSA